MLRRVKTYTAQTGVVYEFYFVGQRTSPGRASTEYIFDVISDKRARYSVSVKIERAGLDLWAEIHGRSLSAPEQYAAAKLRLQQGFDEISDMLEMGRNLVVDTGNIDSLLDSLDLA